jgi:hypothetical protein
MNSTHPINFIESVLAEDRRISEVQLSVYRYHPHSLSDDCITHSVIARQLAATYERLSAQLDEDEDIAFDSLIKISGEAITKRHFALLDFQTTDASRVEQVSELLIAERHPPRAALVHSGRSYHLYMVELLSHADWVSFMGRILLLNDRDESPTVDDRWVGHRLIAGYGALRWSAKGRPKLPTIIREW